MIDLIITTYSTLENSKNKPVVLKRIENAFILHFVSKYIKYIIKH